MSPSGRHLKTMAATIALLCLTPATYAATEAKTPYEECIDKIDYGAMKNSQLMACADEDLEREDAKLNDTYKKLIRIIPGESKAASKDALIKAQRNWISYRDGWCNYVATLPYAPSSELNRIWCLSDLTREQNKKLSSMLSDFVSWDR